MTLKKTYHTSLADRARIEKEIEKETEVYRLKKELQGKWINLNKEITKYQAMQQFPMKNKIAELQKQDAKIEKLAKEYASICII